MARGKWERKGTRTKVEDAARDSARSLVRSLGSYISKVHKTHVFVAPCSRWPQGLVTAFNGWVDLHHRLVSCSEMPDLVTDGIYVRGPESLAEASAAKSVGLRRDRSFRADAGALAADGGEFGGDRSYAEDAV